MKKIYIHIGTYKTATSSIQFVLGKEESFSHPDVCFLRSGRNMVLKKHLRLYDAIIDDGCNTQRAAKVDYATVKRNITNEISNSDCDVFVISEEELSFPDQTIAERMRFLKELGEVEVLMVVREQAAFLDSLYRQFMKENARHIRMPFDEFLDNSLTILRADFAAIADNWSRVFGQQSVRVADFDAFKTNKGVVAEFFGWSGIPHHKIPDVGRFNDSISAAESEAIRHALIANPHLNRTPMVNFFRDQDNQFIESYLTKPRIERIVERYRTSNQQLAQRYKVNIKPRVAEDGFDPHAHTIQLGADALIAAGSLTAHIQSKLNDAKHFLETL